MQERQKLVVGILAHVDAGKTTLSEALLYRSGILRRLGRVDHRDAFLDTDETERERGITIFSKTARLPLPNGREMILLDTPGHVDFTAETARVLPVLDAAVLVISATDGVQSHTKTLWQLLRRAHVPTFLFVNKTDLLGVDLPECLKELQTALDCAIVSVDYGSTSKEQSAVDCGRNAEISLAESFGEACAGFDDELLEEYLETGILTPESVRNAIAACRLFPCVFGSALKLTGIDNFLSFLSAYAPRLPMREDFGARVYKISRDAQGNRLSWMKITGGALRPKMLLRDGDWSEKTEQVRLYSGAKFTAAEQAVCGDVCAVTGLTKTFAGEGLGSELTHDSTQIDPVLSYRAILPPDLDRTLALRQFRLLSEEDPALAVRWDSATQEIGVCLMGDIQREILEGKIAARFGFSVSFDEGSVVYKETVEKPIEGAGHFEPLRHYAEVHLLLEPGGAGSGVVFDTLCSENILGRNWQRLILSQLEEETPRGVLTGSALTDIRISLLSGRAHPKHTEGGDFREAAVRALRQGLRRAKCVLLEPYYAFRLELPAQSVGRAMADLSVRHASMGTPQSIAADTMLLTGTAPVATLRSYGREVAAYTSGRGHCTLTPDGYRPCHNAQEVIAAFGYDPDRDLSYPADSVFCANGGGFVVPWNQADAHMHIPVSGKRKTEEMPISVSAPSPKKTAHDYAASRTEDDLLNAIFEKTYGPIRHRRADDGARVISLPPAEPAKKKSTPPPAPRHDYLLVDGYNMIYAWKDLEEIAKDNLHLARRILLQMLGNYQACTQCHLIAVFDAYAVAGGRGSITEENGVTVVYTREKQTADAYIEKTTYQLGRRYRVRVATSDYAEQLVILGNGALRMSAGELRAEIERAAAEMREILATHH